MSNPRLLTDEEIKQAVGDDLSEKFLAVHREVCKAQDAKTAEAVRKEIIDGIENWTVVSLGDEFCAGKAYLVPVEFIKALKGEKPKGE